MKWTDTVIKAEERDNFKGDCLYLERELTISMERMTAAALIFEYVSELDSTEEVEREKIQLLRKALYNAKRADRHAKMTIAQCSDQAAPSTLADLKNVNFTRMVLTGQN
jgi:transcription initiation factor TFIIIB Brf1 subunit/transcription initiation factor TFIIB